MNNTEKLLATSLDDYDKKFKAVIELMYRIQYAKTKSYGNSCFRRSLTGVMHNVFRKTDRLDSINAADPAIWEHPEQLSGETVLDTICDAAVYLVKLLTAYSVTHPEQYAALKKYIEAQYAETVEKEEKE